MAERRAIKSSIWDDTWFGRLTPFEMVLWIGLFSRCADDQGRFQNDPALIRSKLFPFQDVTLKEIKDGITSFNGHLILYTKGEDLAQIVRWWDNQPMQYATPSNYPPPDGWQDHYRTNYKKQYIAYNWPGQENSPLGVLLWDVLKSLPRQSSWITNLGTLNYNPNYNPNQVPLTNKNEGAEKPKTIQEMVEEMTGYIAQPGDIPALDEMETMGVVKEDIEKAVKFFKDHGKVARGAANLLQSVKFQVAQRTQESVAKKAQSNGKAQPIDQSQYNVVMPDYLAGGK